MTTTRVTHATPAGSYAHTAFRDWEDDYAMSLDGVDTTACSDIAEQLIEKEPGKNFKVVMGGGRAYFTPESVVDPETQKGGRRLDDRNLVEEWKSSTPSGAYVTTRDELLQVNLTETDSIFG